MTKYTILQNNYEKQILFRSLSNFLYTRNQINQVTTIAWTFDTIILPVRKEETILQYHGGGD